MALCSGLSSVVQHLICRASCGKSQLFLCSPRSSPKLRLFFQISRKRHRPIATRTMNGTRDSGFLVNNLKLLLRLAWVGCGGIRSTHSQYLTEVTSRALSTIVSPILHFWPSTDIIYRYSGLVRLECATASSPDARRALAAFATIFHNPAS